MDISDEDEKLIFLNKAVKLSADYVPLKLKSYFRLMCKPYIKRYDKKRKGNRCVYCLTEWNQDQSYRVKLMPAVKPGPAIKRILRKQKGDKKLSNLENKLLKRAQRGTRIVTTCLVCNRRTTEYTTKSKLIKKYTPEFEITEIQGEKEGNKFVDDIPIVTLDSTDNITSPFVIDTHGDFLQRESVPTASPATVSNGFIPLEASTPDNARRRKRKSNVVANPFCVKNIGMKTKMGKGAEKKRLSSIKKLIEEDCHKSLSPNNSLKNFLSSFK